MVYRRLDCRRDDLTPMRSSYQFRHAPNSHYHIIQPYRFSAFVDQNTKFSTLIKHPRKDLSGIGKIDILSQHEFGSISELVNRSQQLLVIFLWNLVEM